MNDLQPLDEKLTTIVGAFTQAQIPYAIGGAIALGYYGEPRGTIDIDINIFVAPARAKPVLDLLAKLNKASDVDSALETVYRDGQVRLRWEHTPVDLFFASDAFHEVCARRTRTVPFGTGSIEILAAEDLMIFKALFNRRKDWLDIEQVLFATAGELDTGYVRDWLLTLVGERGSRVKSFDDATRTILGD